MYLYSIGELDIKAVRWRNEKIGWVMFILATFSLNVMFMNMIISII